MIIQLFHLLPKALALTIIVFLTTQSVVAQTGVVNLSQRQAFSVAPATDNTFASSGADADAVNKRLQELFDPQQPAGILGKRMFRWHAMAWDKEDPNWPKPRSTRGHASYFDLDYVVGMSLEPRPPVALEWRYPDKFGSLLPKGVVGDVTMSLILSEVINRYHFATTSGGMADEINVRHDTTMSEFALTTTLYRASQQPFRPFLELGYRYTHARYVEDWTVEPDTPTTVIVTAHTEGAHFHKAVIKPGFEWTLHDKLAVRSLIDLDTNYTLKYTSVRADLIYWPKDRWFLQLGFFALPETDRYAPTFGGGITF